ncbi:flagellar basal body rod protein FlgB [Desulfobulbus oligotrophicus]|nr:flagellar basal body rod protein FlgB [Desulfobulbus oligotrophicus]
MSSIHQLDRTMQLLHKVLDLRTKNQEIISSNIANAETPGYAAQSFTFEEALRGAVTDTGMRSVTTHAGHIPVAPDSLEHVHGTVTISRDTTGIGDNNTISVDQEMVKLSENEILYETAVTMLNKKIALLKYAANGGA